MNPDQFTVSNQDPRLGLAEVVAAIESLLRAASPMVGAIADIPGNLRDRLRQIREGLRRVVPAGPDRSEQSISGLRAIQRACRAKFLPGSGRPLCGIGDPADCLICHGHCPAS